MTLQPVKCGFLFCVYYFLSFKVDKKFIARKFTTPKVKFTHCLIARPALFINGCKASNDFNCSLKMNFVVVLASVSVFCQTKLVQSQACNSNCGENEVYTTCTPAQFQATCWNRFPYQDDLSCETGCVCKKGFIREPNSYKCIAVASCPKTPNKGICPINEIWSDCGFRCDETCGFFMNRDLICRSCLEGCICKKGFVRSKVTGQCILEKTCNGKI